MDKSKKTGVVVGASVLALVVAWVLLFPTFSIEAAYPALKAKHWLSRKVMRRCCRVFSAFDAVGRCERLNREVASLLIFKSECERLELENQRLRAALGFAESAENKWLPAAVTSGGGAVPLRNRLRILRGSNDGVMVGAVVITPDGLVGRVESVSAHTAVVATIVDPSVMVACEIVGVGEVPARGVLAGGTEAALKLKYLKATYRPKERSAVVTSGRGGVFPRGIQVGSLIAVEKSRNGRYDDGEVLPKVDFLALEEVFVHCEK